MSPAEQVKSQLDIVAVVSHYIQLKKQGARHVGLCPFHSEKTPSFGVHSAPQYYKCFGCDAAGDVFTFVQQIESLTFPETLKLLRERYGIVTAGPSSAKPRPRLSEAELATAEQFAIALTWHVEELLTDRKAQMWAAFGAGLPLKDNAPLFSEPVRELTGFLAEVKRWPVHGAAQALREFGRSQPVLTAELLAEIQTFETLLARFICDLAPRERAA